MIYDHIISKVLFYYSISVLVLIILKFIGVIKWVSILMR